MAGDDPQQRPLSAGALRALCTRLRAAAAPRAGAAAERALVTAIARVSEAWCDPQLPARAAATAELAASTGYAPPMIGAALDPLFRTLCAPQLEALLAAEWEAVRDARRPRLVLHVPAGTVLPPAIVGPVATLLLGAGCLLRPAQRIRALPVRWAASLIAAHPPAGRQLAVAYWPRARTDLTRAALAAADTAVLHGDDASLEALAALAPAGTHLVRHGHRLSAAVVSGAWLGGRLPQAGAALARDVALYDQAGCLSPHTVLVIEDGSVTADELAAALAAALAELAGQLPCGRLDPAAAAAARHFLAARELECYALGGTMRGGWTAGWTVFVDRRPTYEAAPAGRVVFVKAVGSLAAAAAALAPLRGVLQAIGLGLGSGADARLRAALGIEAAATVTGPEAAIRLCPLGSMQEPPLGWAADGLPPLASQCRPAAGAHSRGCAARTSSSERKRR